MVPSTDTNGTVPWQQEDTTTMGSGVFYSVCAEMLQAGQVRSRS
jgi:hypothetical protein